MPGNTLASLSYGISTPAELFEKLKTDGERLSLNEHPHPHDVFNFVVTSAVLNEWIRKAHKHEAEVKSFIEALDTDTWNLLPERTSEWIVERSNVLATGPDIRYHVLNVLQLTWQTANASKHFHWTTSSGVTDIQNEPIVGNWHQFFYTSRAPDLYVEYKEHSYGLSEIRSVLVQFFGGFLQQIGSEVRANEA